MAADQRAPMRRDVAGASRPRIAPLARLFGGGTIGNERLTALTGIALIVLLAVIGLTLLRLRTLISVHLFVGLLLIPPVLLKMASTGYRFARYYTLDAIYRQRGAPPIPLRLSAPIVVLSTIGVFATGVALLLVGPASTGPLRLLHKASFIVWVAFTALHVLGHLPDIVRALFASTAGRLDYRPYRPGGMGRGISLAGALVGGVVLAILLIPHFGAWVHAEHVFRDR